MSKQKTGLAGQAAALPARRRNPLNRWPGMAPILTVRRFLVVIDQEVAGGEYVLRGHPLRVCHSRHQLKKALARICRTRPQARGVEVRVDREYADLPDVGRLVKVKP